jgi:hypothetical protein
MIRPEDLRMTHWYSGPGKAGAYRLTHVPSGISVFRRGDPHTPIVKIQKELLEELEAKLLAEDSGHQLS